MGICRCVLRGGGTEPFLFNWINIVIHILSIDISIDIHCPVATLGWQFATWVWHPLSRPPPALCVGTLYARKPSYQYAWNEKLPDERGRCRPKALVVKQGLHPPPGPSSMIADSMTPMVGNGLGMAMTRLTCPMMTTGGGAATA